MELGGEGRREMNNLKLFQTGDHTGKQSSSVALPYLQQVTTNSYLEKIPSQTVLLQSSVDPSDDLLLYNYKSNADSWNKHLDIL